MNGRGMPSGHSNGYWGDSFDAATDWFTPVAEAPTAVGLLERTDAGQYQAYPAGDPRHISPEDLSITPDDVFEALGPDADDLLASVDVDVDELIRLINAETTVLPPLVLPEVLPEADGADGPPPEVAEAISSWKQRFLKGAVAAVIVTLTGAGGAAAAMDKSVTVEVDGKERQVNSYDSTVGEVLEDEGIHVGPHDALSPSPQAQISHGDKITLDKGRLLKMTVDGQPREEWVRSVTVGQALRQLGVPDDGSWVSADRHSAVPENGMNLVVKTSKTITVSDGASEPRQLTTHAVDVKELLAEQKLQVGPEDHVTPGSDQKITNGAEVRIDRTGNSVIQVRTPIAPPVQKIVDSSMFKGEEKVQNPGTPGEKLAFVRVSTKNGDETARETINEKVLKEATPKILRVGGKERPNSDVWDKLVQCEATGNWAMNSGNGYYGGLQFDKSTWDAFGGDQYAAYPHQASREQQISIAEKVRDSRGGGYGAWPSCSGKLGLD